MPLILFQTDGGELVLPDPLSLLATREDGGNLVVNPPRTVWERSELSADELGQWQFLVAAAGRAMIDSLPQLDGGCINYWEAGNWALNPEGDPKGPKRAPDHRKVHLHLMGRNPRSTNPKWQWGESPVFPRFRDRHTWSSGFERLTPDECTAVVTAAEQRLREGYGVPAIRIQPWSRCRQCGYPTPASKQRDGLCAECSP